MVCMFDVGSDKLLFFVNVEDEENLVLGVCGLWIVCWCFELFCD